MLSGVLNPWVAGWTFEAWTNRAEVREALHGRRLAGAADAIADLGVGNVPPPHRPSHGTGYR
jgi:hypothetical protein